MRSLKLVVGLALLTSCVSSSDGVLPVDERLWTMDSPHFTFIYQAPLSNQMAKLVRDCEDAHALLTPIFGWSPREKTVVFFSDSDDLHNGWATVFPRPMMMIYAADTPPGSTIYEPGDYIRRTVFHEYTHILSMDPQFGLNDRAARFFGRVLPIAGDPLSTLITYATLPPGAVAPIWFIEGLAMWTETELVGPGRGRNTLVDMIVRMAASEGRLLAPPQWDLHHPEWPFGEAGYIYGLKLLQYLHETYGAGETERNVAGELSLAVTDALPFFFNHRSYAATSKSFSQLAWESLQHEQVRQADRIETLAAKPFTPTARLTPESLQVFHPRFDRTGRYIYFVGREEEKRSQIYEYDITNQQVRRLFHTRTDGSFSKLAPTPDRSFFYFTRIDSPRREQYRSALYQFDALRSRTRQVASEGRYRFPSIHPDHTHLVAVRAEGGIQSIIEVSIPHAGRRDRERILVEAPANTTLVDPVYAPDRKTVVYVRSDENSSQLRRLTLETGEDIILLDWPSLIVGPVFHPRGRDLVFVSDRNGVYNLYRLPYRTNARPIALTHALGGVFEPDFSPDGRQLVATAYDSHGYYLVRFDYADMKSVGALPALLPSWTPLYTK